MVDNISKPFTFTANTYAKASEVNADFDTLYTGVNACVNQINASIADIDSMDDNKANVNGNSTQRFAVANPVTDGDAINLRTLKAMYPVGSIYIGTMEECPMASLFGTWTKRSTGVITEVNSNVPIKGTGQKLGLNNSGSTAVGNLYLYRSSYNEAVLTASGGTRGDVYVTASENDSGIVGTVSSTTLTVNIWERTE